MGDDAGKSGHVDVKAARIPDRDRPLRELIEAGPAATPGHELALQVGHEPRAPGAPPTKTRGKSSTGTMTRSVGR